MVILTSECKDFSRFVCLKDFHHFIGIDICLSCEIPSKWCGVMRNLERSYFGR